MFELKTWEPFVPPEPIVGETIERYHRRVTDELTLWANRTIKAAIARLEPLEHSRTEHKLEVVLGPYRDAAAELSNWTPEPTAKRLAVPPSKWRPRNWRNRRSTDQ